MVDGVLQVKDAIFKRVADVIFRVAGCGHLLIQRAFHQLLVLQHKQWNTKLTLKFVFVIMVTSWEHFTMKTQKEQLPKPTFTHGISVVNNNVYVYLQYADICIIIQKNLP